MLIVMFNKGDQSMFLSTPFVRYVVNRYFESGKLDEIQRELLIRQDWQLNVVSSAVGLMVVFGHLF